MPLKNTNFGFIYPIFNFIINLLKKLNLVELLKFISFSYFPLKTTDADDLRGRINIVIDIFIILKFLIVFLLIFFNCNDDVSYFVVVYLSFFNIYTYFYHHVWNLPVSSLGIIRERRRFINLILSFSFSNICFAYFYGVIYVDQILWPESENIILNSIWLSTAKSMFIDFQNVELLKGNVSYIVIIQSIVTFIFASIILSNTIPKHGENY